MVKSGSLQRSVGLYPLAYLAHASARDAHTVAVGHQKCLFAPLPIFAQVFEVDDARFMNADEGI